MLAFELCSVINSQNLGLGGQILSDILDYAEKQLVRCWKYLTFM